MGLRILLQLDISCTYSRTCPVDVKAEFGMSYRPYDFFLSPNLLLTAVTSSAMINRIGRDSYGCSSFSVASCCIGNSPLTIICNNFRQVRTGGRNLVSFFIIIWYIIPLVVFIAQFIKAPIRLLFWTAVLSFLRLTLYRFWSSVKLLYSLERWYSCQKVPHSSSKPMNTDRQLFFVTWMYYIHTPLCWNRRRKV